MRRATRLALTLVITGLALAYLLSKIDLSQTWEVLSHASLGWYLLAVAIMAGTVWPMAWRWQRLLLAQAIPDRLSWVPPAGLLGGTGRGDPGPALVARARVLRGVHGRADPADVDRRRRDEDLRDVAPPSREHRAGDR